MKFNEIKRSIVINTSSQIVAKGATIILGFLTVGLLTRYLGVSQYGVYTLAFAYLAFFGIFADFGLQLSLVRDLSGASNNQSDLKSTYFSIKVLLTIFSTALSLIVLIFFPYASAIKMAIVVGSFAVGLGYMNGYGASVLQSKVRLDTAALLEVVNRIITVVAIVVFVLLHLNLLAIISTILIGNFVSLVCYVILVPDYFRFKQLPPISLIINVLKRAFPIGVTSLLMVLYFKIDTLMLSLMKSTTDVGIYSLSYKIFENIIMLWLFYTASIYPLMSGYINNNENKRLINLVKTSLIIAVSVSGFIAIVGYFATPIVVSILGGKNFAPSVIPFRILLLALPFVFINNTIYFLFLSMSKIKEIIYILTISLFLNIGMNLLIIPKYSYVGISISTVITELVVLAGYLYIWTKSRNKYE